MEPDDLIISGEADKQTTTPSGEVLSTRLDGVQVEKTVDHVDYRGRVFEVFSGMSEFWREPIVFAHCSSIRPGGAKGWGVHLQKSDRYCLIRGEILLVLFDSRKSSPTSGSIMEIVLSEASARKVLIPPGVWHLSVNVGLDEAYLMNFPTEPYNHDSPDKMRLPIGTPLIPYDLQRVERSY